MYGFGAMIKQLKKDPKTIVFTEGSDPRILEAASRLLASSFLTPILLGKPDEVQHAAEEGSLILRIMIKWTRWLTASANSERARA